MFNGYLLHRSLPNRARSGLRRALVNHYMSAQSLLPWTRPPADVHVAKWDSRDIVMVAGKDPYAWRGTTDTSRPHIRRKRTAAASGSKTPGEKALADLPSSSWRARVLTAG
jgi:hypothetical protein